MYLFTYGTLMKGLLRNSALGDSEYVGEFYVPSYRYLLLSLGAFPALVQPPGTYIQGLRATHGIEPSDSIRGEVYDVGDREVWKLLDAIEGAPHFYYRQDMYVYNSPADADSDIKRTTSIAYTLRSYDATAIGSRIILNGDWRDPELSSEDIVYSPPKEDELQGLPRRVRDGVVRLRRAQMFAHEEVDIEEDEVMVGEWHD